MNFGLIYGMGEPKLARQLGVTASKAKEMFTAYHTGAPYAKATMQACIDEASLYGTITTILGRKSRFDLWQPADYGVDGAPTTYANALMKYGNIKRASTHKALNRRLQGSAADQMKMAMRNCWRDGIFAATGVPSLTVHDELDFIDEGGRDEAFRAMQHEMETCLKLRVPVRADYEIGWNWGDVGDPAAFDRNVRA
jgi:DNA polymerase-1